MEKHFTHTLVTFDISNNRSRTKLGESLKDLGMARIQESVFYGRLNRPERATVRALLQDHCEALDRAVLIPNISNEDMKKYIIGYPDGFFDWIQVEVE